MKITVFAAAMLAGFTSLHAQATPITVESDQTQAAGSDLALCVSAECGLDLSGLSIESNAIESNAIDSNAMVVTDFRAARPVGDLVVSDDGRFSGRQMSRYTKYCSTYSPNAFSPAQSCYQDTRPTSSVPEPGTLLLLGSGLLLLATRRRA